jgi:hypothetical protein
VAYKGCRVEIAGFRSNTAPKLIDVADYFIDLGEFADYVKKDISQGDRYDVPSFVPPTEIYTPPNHHGVGDFSMLTEELKLNTSSGFVNPNCFVSPVFDESEELNLPQTIQLNDDK